jgi:hypothetical protein
MIQSLALGIALPPTILAVVALFVWAAMTIHADKLWMLIGSMGCIAVLFIGALIAMALTS